MKNKVYISLGIVIAGIAIAYYFFVTLPQVEKYAKLFSLKQQCAQTGEQYYQKILVQNARDNAKDQALVPGSSWQENQPKYIYNEKLNTCLYEEGGTFCDVKNSCLETKSIIDLSTNQTLVSYDGFPNDFSKVTQREWQDRINFDTQETQLFGKIQ